MSSPLILMSFGPRGRMLGRAAIVGAALLGTAACQGSPTPRSGHLTSYAALPEAGQPAKSSGHRSGDDAASDAITAVFIVPAVLAPGIDTELSDEERMMVLREVDRQICFELSERFVILPAPATDGASIRTIIVGLQSNSRVGSAAAAAVDFVNPLSFVNFRVPATTGGLAVESELLGADGRQIAAIVWSKKAGVVGRTKPSLSRAGDALQLAEPLGDTIAATFASDKRPKRKIATPDPCARFGSRSNIGRSLASGVVSAGTGLYLPQLAGTGMSKEEAAKLADPHPPEDP